jgi:hypothetical protein
VKQASYGLETHAGKRWCSPCAKAHGACSRYFSGCVCIWRVLTQGWGWAAGAVNKARTLCQDCGVKNAYFGLANSQRRLWCATCATAHGAWSRYFSGCVCIWRVLTQRCGWAAGAVRTKSRCEQMKVVGASLKELLCLDLDYFHLFSPRICSH